MKKYLCLLALLPVLAMAEHHEKSEPVSQVLRHIVILKFKDEATKEETTMIEKEFVALEKKIPTITGLEWGTNVSPEDRAEGFTHCFVVSFRDMAGLKVYGPHEEHQAFVTKLKPVLDKVLVFDFVTEN